MFLRQPFCNKFSTHFSATEYSVVQRAGNSVYVVAPDGSVLKSNITHVKRIIKGVSNGDSAKDVDDNDETATNHQAQTHVPGGSRIPPIRESCLLRGKFKDFDIGRFSLCG